MSCSVLRTKNAGRKNKSDCGAEVAPAKKPLRFSRSCMSPYGHLRPFMPQKTRVGNDRSQSTTDVPRRRNRNEKLHKAGARSSVTLAAQNADRRAAVSEIELALSTRCRHRVEAVSRH